MQNSKNYTNKVENWIVDVENLLKIDTPDTLLAPDIQQILQAKEFFSSLKSRATKHINLVTIAHYPCIEEVQPATTLAKIMSLNPKVDMGETKY